MLGSSEFNRDVSNVFERCNIYLQWSTCTATTEATSLSLSLIALHHHSGPCFLSLSCTWRCKCWSFDHPTSTSLTASPNMSSRASERLLWYVGLHEPSAIGTSDGARWTAKSVISADRTRRSSDRSHRLVSTNGLSLNGRRNCPFLVVSPTTSEREMELSCGYPAVLRHIFSA